MYHCSLWSMLRCRRITVISATVTLFYFVVYWLTRDSHHRPTIDFLIWPLRRNISLLWVKSNDHSTQSPVPDGKPVLIFLHVPKTGGSYIRTILNYWCISTHKCCFIPTKEIPYKAALKVRSMNQSERDRIDVIFGHFPFGIHRVLQLQRPIQYFTILRDPIRQTVSAFHYSRFLRHYLGGAFGLESILRQLNDTWYQGDSFFNGSSKTVLLDYHRNTAISYLTQKHPEFINAKGFFARCGGSEGWAEMRNISVEHVQSLTTPSLVKLAVEVIRRSCRSNASVSLSPALKTSFRQYVTAHLDLNSPWKDQGPSWHFGNNPVASILCCSHLWFNQSLEIVDSESYSQCPRIRTIKTLNCALENMNQFQLVLSAEKMELSLRLLERFLNWTIPKQLKQLRMNTAVHVPPVPSPISSQDLTLVEKLTHLDRIVYQTGLLKFWSSVHSSSILL